MRIQVSPLFAALIAACSFCLAAQGQTPAAAVSCPKKPGKILIDIAVRVLPGGRTIDGEGDEKSASFDLTSPRLKAGETIQLDCMYGPPGSQTGTVPGRVIAPANHELLAVPASATYCEFMHSPNRAKCAKVAAQ